MTTREGSAVTEETLTATGSVRSAALLELCESLDELNASATASQPIADLAVGLALVAQLQHHPLHGSQRVITGGLVGQIIAACTRSFA